jgi:DNA polymerase III sliding clamp (beta) subunit (PCNA family)
MLMDRNLKPELCASRDETREHLTVLHLNVERRELAATDGHRMVVVPIEPEQGDVTGPITVAALAAARKHDPKNAHVRVFANGKLETGWNGNGPTFKRPQGLKFPPYTKFLEPPAAEYHFTLGINARYLTQAAAALGTEDITLTVYFDAPEDPSSKVGLYGVTVRDNSLTPSGVCIVMPMKVAGQE